MSGKGYIERRAMKVAQHIVNNDETVRATAEYFGFKHAMVHRDIRKVLPEVDGDLADKVDEVMERHIRNRACIINPYYRNH